MEIEIPSPSVFLRQGSVPPASAPAPVKTSTNRRGTGPKRSPPKPKTIKSDASAQSGESTKLRQGKSRNGCITCKKKRLKCDETKPICVQCEKRNTECGGYKKDFKWRSFEEITKQSRAGRGKKPQNTTAEGDSPTQEFIEPAGQPSSSYENDQASWSSSLSYVFTSATEAIVGDLTSTEGNDLTNPPLRLSPTQYDPLQSLHLDFSPSDDDFPSFLPASDSQPERFYENAGCSSFSTGLPTLANILQPRAELRNPPDPPALRHPQSPLTGEPEFDESSILVDTLDPDDDDECGEEIGYGQPGAFTGEISGSQWMFGPPSPADSPSSTSSSQSTDLTLFKTPAFDPSSPEMLMLRFHRETCGILSIKDGPSENPWRTFIWPLAKDSQALYHAILAMAALHGATTQPQLRLTAITHMTKSISKLSAEMHKMSLDQILATALALALGESWDDKFSTGIQHLKGAKTLLNNALVQRRKNLQLGQLNREDAKRLKFLSNTYVYLLAIARLTSSEEHDDINLDRIVQDVNEPLGSFEYEIDPLMGCATTLFPLLGKVGSLIQRIRKTPTNSLTIISEANELREQLLQWEPPDMDLFEQPEDPSSSTRHALHTAEAYRRAILLHLHSAVTELSSESSLDQAKGTLTMLASTPLSSRTMIVQIFPLLVGSCEMIDPDDRQWVAQRWDAMMKRLTIVNVSSCWKIVQEVWRRRDRWVEMQAQRTMPRIGRKISPGNFILRPAKRKTNSGDSATEDAFFDTFPKDDDTSNTFLPRAHDPSLTSNASASIGPRRPTGRPPRHHTDESLLNGEIQYTVRGHLHWLGVMSDWKWDVFL